MAASSSSAHATSGIVPTVGGFQGAGAGGGLGLNAPGAGPKVTHFASGGSRKNGPSIPDEVASTWTEILDDASSKCFMLCLYSSNGKSLELAAQGPSDGPAGGCGLNEMIAALEANPGTCGWGGFRVNAVDNRQNTISKRPKFIFVQFMPPTASAMRKAKMGPHKGALKQVLHGAHCDVLVEDPREDLEPETLVKLLQAATGAHKPNGYEFNVDEITDADYYKDL